MVNKKARTSMEAADAAAVRTEEDEEGDDDGSYDDEDDYDSDASDSDDEEELEALQLLSDQIQEAKRANQILKQALMASVGAKEKDNSSSELVASLMAGRKGGYNNGNDRAGAPLSSLQDTKPAANGNL